MSRRFLTSGSTKITTTCVLCCASPVLITGFAISSSGDAACAALFDSASYGKATEQIWVLSCSGNAPVATAYFLPIKTTFGLVLAASGNASAMVAWER